MAARKRRQGRPKRIDNHTVEQIRLSLSLGEKQEYIAVIYGVSQSMVSRIKTGHRRRGES